MNMSTSSPSFKIPKKGSKVPIKKASRRSVKPRMIAPPASCTVSLVPSKKVRSKLSPSKDNSETKTKISRKVDRKDVPRIVKVMEASISNQITKVEESISSYFKSIDIRSIASKAIADLKTAVLDELLSKKTVVNFIMSSTSDDLESNPNVQDLDGIKIFRHMVVINKGGKNKEIHGILTDYGDEVDFYDLDKYEPIKFESHAGTTILRVQKKQRKDPFRGL